MRATPSTQYHMIYLWCPKACLLMVTWNPWKVSWVSCDSLIVFTRFPSVFLSFSSARLKQAFQNTLRELPQCQYLSFLFLMVKPVPLRICSLRFAREKFWGSHSFCHQEGSSKWLSVFPTIEQNVSYCLNCYPDASSQHTQTSNINTANVQLLPPVP